MVRIDIVDFGRGHLECPLNLSSCSTNVFILQENSKELYHHVNCRCKWKTHHERKNPNLLQIVVPVTFPKQRENNLCENFVTNWSLVCVCQNSKRFDLIDKFNYTSRYLYDIFTIDNPALAEHIPDIYSRELGVGAFVNGLSQISSFFSFSWIKQILPTKKHLSWI